MRIAALALALVCSLLAGCAGMSTVRLDADLLEEDKNTCAARPRRLPGCIVGAIVYVKWKF